MSPFGNKNKVKRPKFLFNLQINELVNIPQSSGYCFVKWNFKEGTGTSGTNIANDSNFQISSQNKGFTNHIPIKHHRVQWNYSLSRPIQIKLQVDKNKNIVPKMITFEVYLETTTQLSHNQTSSGETHSNNSNSPIAPVLSNKSSFLRTPSFKSSTSFDLRKCDLKIDGTNSINNTNNNNNNNLPSLGANIYPQKKTGKTFLGKIEVNVAEYIRQNEEPITNRFLLKDSKINSILNATFQLKLIRGSYEDFNISHIFTTGQLSSPFQNGLPNLLDNSMSDISSTPTSSTFSTHNYNNNNNNNSNNSNSSAKSNFLISPLTQSLTKPNTYSYSFKANGLSTISGPMTPLIDSLYEKTFKLPWDERPNEYSPRECIEDILNGGNGWAKNENGVALIDLQALRLKNIESEYYHSNSNSNSNNHNYNDSRSPNGQQQRKNFHFLADKIDEKYWNNMDNREYLERKHQHLVNQNSPTDDGIANNNYYPNSNEYSITYNGKNGPLDQVVRNTKSWSVR